MSKTSVATFTLMRKIFSILVVVALCGCEKAHEDSHVQDTVVPLEVNGVRFTESDLSHEIDFREFLVRTLNPRANITNLHSHIAQQVTNSVVVATLFKTALDARGIQIPEAVSNDVLSKYEKALVRGKIKSLADFESLLATNKLIDAYTNVLSGEMAQNAYLEAVHGAEMRVEERDIDYFLKRIENYNKMVAATNALAYAKATNLWMRIKAGEDFAALADKESEDPDREKGGVLGECEEVDFSYNPGYWEKVSLLKKGEVSDVITTDVGIEIVKALSSLAPSENTGEPALQLARIYIRRAMSNPEWTREEAKMELEKSFREDAIRASYLEISSNATIIVNGKKLDLTPQEDQKETPPKKE